MLYDDERGYTYAKECECGLAEEERQKNKLKFANIPKMYGDITLRDVKASMYSKDNSRQAIKIILSSIKYWLEHLDVMKEEGRGLFLWSQEKGTGKTMTAVALANMLMSQGERVKFATSMQIIAEIKRSWDKESNTSESQLIYDLSTVDFLVIDDFGTETVKDWISERFYNIINARYVEKKITIFTSNNVINQLDYDERILNRIAERSFKLHFPEESVRAYIGQLKQEEMNKEVAKMIGG